MKLVNTYRKLIIVGFFFTFFVKASHAQSSLLSASQDTLKRICKQLYAAPKDVDKKRYNQELLKAFERALSIDGAFDFAFDSLTDIARLTPPDKKFRILNWNVPYEDGTQEYFGFIQYKHVVTVKGKRKSERNETLMLYPLIDKSMDIKNPENSISDNKNWYGMLYYAIIPKKTKKQTYYTLLGWDGNDKFSKKKIIDVLTFDSKGVPRFGADIFVTPKKKFKRVIFEYASSCSMSLKYNSKKDSIVFDHLAPENPSLVGQYQYYCPDMSYDGFGFKQGKWNYGEDLNIVNDKNHNDKFYNDPHNPKTTSNTSNQIVPKRKKKSPK
jgi:hypothetical protein